MSFKDGDLHKRVEELEEENERLREIIADLWPRASFTMHTDNRLAWEQRIREEGVEI